MFDLQLSKLLSRQLMQTRDTWFTRLTDIFTGKATGPLFVNGITGTSSINPYLEPESWVYACLQNLEENAEVLQDPGTFRLPVVQCDIYGVHFIDRMFGARVYATEQGWWSDPLTKPVGSLTPPDLDRDDTWQVAKRMVTAFMASKATVPAFGLPTIASAMNIAVNLYNEEFLVALLADPIAARHDLQVINDLLCDLHRWYLAHLPPVQLQPVMAVRRVQPPGYGQLCGCTTHLISASQYRDNVASLDNALLATYPHGGMIHLCGIHTQHIPVWREMPALKAVQLNDRAVDDLEAYYYGLRADQIIYLRPTRNMPLTRVMSITNGNRVVIMGQAPQKGS